jgi:hypothetical protein
MVVLYFVFPSDKGSGIAIMDADKYKDETESDLNDNTT